MFVLRGEIDIEGRKGIKTLRDTQAEATRTSETFKRAGMSGFNLSRSFLGVNSSAGLTNKSLMMLGRAGAIGAGLAIIYKATMGIADAFNALASEAYQSGKTMDKAFSSGITSKSVEGTKSAIEQLKEEQRRLGDEAAKFNPFRLLLKGLENITGIQFGGNIIETDIETINQQIRNLQIQLELRKQEEKKLLEIRKSEQGIFKDRERAAMSDRLQRILGVRETVIEQKSAEDAVRFEERRLKLAEENLAVIQQRNKIEPDLKALNEAQFAVDKQRLEVQKAQLTLAEKTAKARKEDFKTASGFGAQILESTAAGRGALETARRRRAREVKNENYRIAQSIAPTAADREHLAMQVAAMENTTLAERLFTAQTQTSAEELAVKRKTYRPFGAILDFMMTGGQSGQFVRDVGTGIGFKIGQKQSTTDIILSEIRSEISNLNKIVGGAPLVTDGSGK
jgi:hypothetical protein